MSVSPAETRDVFRTACEYPVDRDTVRKAVGHVRLRTPRGGDEPIASILERVDVDRFDSVAHLHESLMARLDDRHIGRKYYDDRSRNPARETEIAL